jgi:hypothetical protein
MTTLTAQEIQYWFWLQMSGGIRLRWTPEAVKGIQTSWKSKSNPELEKALTQWRTL